MVEHDYISASIKVRGDRSIRCRYPNRKAEKKEGERRGEEGRKRRMGSSAKAGSRWWTPDRCRMCIFLFRPKSCILIRIVSVSLVSDFDENCKAVRNRPTPGEKKIYIYMYSLGNFINGRDHLSIEFFRSSCFSKAS